MQCFSSQLLHLIWIRTIVESITTTVESKIRLRFVLIFQNGSMNIALTQTVLVFMVASNNFEQE